MRILHVEDDEDTRKLVECILQGKGWQGLQDELEKQELTQHNHLYGLFFLKSRSIVLDHVI